MFTYVGRIVLLALHMHIFFIVVTVRKIFAPHAYGPISLQ